MELIYWSNLPQKFFDLVKSAIFCAPSKPSCVWFATARGRADDPLSNEEWTVEYQKEVDADKELERTLNDRLEGNIGVNAAHGTCLLFLRLLRSRFKKYTFVLTLKSVGFLELF